MDENYILFKYIKNHEWTKFKSFLQKDDDIDVNIRDENYNYLIQYVVLFNKIDETKLLIQKGCRLDIIDTDGRSILYIPIKYNYVDILKLLLDFNKEVIGISLIDIRDNFGLTGLYYAIIFNNENTFDLLIKEGSSLTIKDKKGNDGIHTAVQYRRLNFVIKIINKKVNLDTYNNMGDTALHLACTLNYTNIAKELINNGANINLQTFKERASPLMYAITQENMEIINILLSKKNINLDLQDAYGNSALHIAIIEKTNKIINLLISNNLNYNLVNLEGNTALHICLSDINTETKLDRIDYLNKLVENTNLNIQNNEGNTCLYLILKKQLWILSKILETKKCNFFISNNQGEVIFDLYDKKSKEFEIILKIATTSYYNQLKNKASDIWKLEWENFCAKDDKEKLLKLTKIKDAKQESICKSLISEYIIKDKKSIPSLKNNNIDVKLDAGIPVYFCTYTGSTIDIISGLLYLQKIYSNLESCLSKNLISNPPILNYYEKIGLDGNFNIEFLNFEILWIYQKLFFPINFDTILEENLKNKKIRFIALPLGIEMASGSHANILIWDKDLNQVERFEPSGSYYPYLLNYNPQLLDQLLENKLTCFDKKLKYFRPSTFIPVISFQQFEINENYSCKKIGDPNGFCAIWCNWWVNMRVKYSDIDREKLIYKLLNKIRQDNISFKNLIRNYAKIISDFRDGILKKINIDINDWINDQYTKEEFLDLNQEFEKYIN